MKNKFLPPHFSFVFAVAFIVLSMCFCASAVIGDVAGDIYSTDIVTFIDSMPIPSYNIGGKTVIIAEELTGYGFNVEWDGQNRILRVTTIALPECAPNGNIVGGAENSVGNVVGKFYETDIICYINGMWVESYNLGGKTALVVEDMATTDDEAKRNSRDGNIHRALGYAPSLMKCKWDGEKRELYLECVRPESTLTLRNGSTVNLDSQPMGVFSAYSRSSWLLTDGNDLINQPTVCTDIGYLHQNDAYYVAMYDEKLMPGVMAKLDDGKIEISFEKDSSGIDIIPKYLYENGYTITTNVNMLLSPKLAMSISGKDVKIPDGQKAAVIYGGELYVNATLISDFCGGSLLSYRYNLPGGMSEKKDDILYTSTLLFINGRQITPYDSASGKLYIAIKDLVPHGFDVKTADGKTWYINSPDSPIPLTEEEKTLHPENYFRPDNRSRMFDVYDGIYKVYAGDKELNDVYIHSKPTNLMPCIDITELCSVFGYSFEYEYLNGHIYRVTIPCLNAHPTA